VCVCVCVCVYLDFNLLCRCSCKKLFGSTTPQKRTKNTPFIFFFCRTSKIKQKTPRSSQWNFFAKIEGRTPNWITNFDCNLMGSQSHKNNKRQQIKKSTLKALLCMAIQKPYTESQQTPFDGHSDEF